MLKDLITYRLTIGDAIDIAQALERDALSRRDDARDCLRRYGPENPVLAMAEAYAERLERHAAALRARYLGTPETPRARLGVCDGCGQPLLHRRTPTMGAVYCPDCDEEIGEELDAHARAYDGGAGGIDTDNPRAALVGPPGPPGPQGPMGPPGRDAPPPCVHPNAEPAERLPSGWLHCPDCGAVYRKGAAEQVDQ